MPGLPPRLGCIRPHPAAIPRGLAAALAAALLAAAPSARADPPAADEEQEPSAGEERPVRLQRPTAVRGTLALYWSPEILLMGGASHDVVLGATLSRQVHSRIALELLAGGGGNSHRSGPHVGGAVRFSPIAWSKHAITLSLGGRAAFLEDYGTVGFGHLEPGYEMRLSGGFNLAVSSGLGVVLNDSRRSHDCGDGVARFFCKDRFEAGDVGFSWRVEVGGSF